MRPLKRAWVDFRDAARLFSRPARHVLLAEFLGLFAHGAFGVLYNLYLVEAGFPESFVGRSLALHGVGIALAALPAGLLADRWGRRRTILAGAWLDGASLLVRALSADPGVILASSLCAGVGQAMLVIPAAPFLTEYSTRRERTHLFSAQFAIALLAGVLGSAFGGVFPDALVRASVATGATAPLFLAYRMTLAIAATFAIAASVPLLRLRRLPEAAKPRRREHAPRGAGRLLVPIALNSFLIGAGAGLVIPFMNLYFKNRFGCSSAQIGTFFAVAQVITAAVALVGPAVAARFGKLRTAVASEFLSLPFLVTLGGERHLPVAVAAFLLRATFMQAATPLLQAFVMETLPPALRARSTSLNHMVWNVGWATSATFAGLAIEKLGFAVPFYLTASLYAIAGATFYAAFRRHSAVPAERAPVPLADEMSAD